MLMYNKYMTTSSHKSQQLTDSRSGKKEQTPADRKAQRRQRTILVFASLIVIVSLVGIGVVAGLFYLFNPNTTLDQVARIRDIFIIVMALESLLIGVSLIVLIIQFASLINLLQNEIRPILEAADETIKHLRGTAEFLGENVIKPVMKLSSYLAGIQRMLELLGLKKK